MMDEKDNKLMEDCIKELEDESRKIGSLDRFGEPQISQSDLCLLCIKKSRQEERIKRRSLFLKWVKEFSVKNISTGDVKYIFGDKKNDIRLRN